MLRVDGGDGERVAGGGGGGEPGGADGGGTVAGRLSRGVGGGGGGSGCCWGRRPALRGAGGAAGVASWPAGFVGGHVTPLDGDGPVLVGPPSMGAALPGRSLAALVGPWPGPGHLSEARGAPGSSARTGGGRCRGASGTGGLGPEMPGDPRAQAPGSPIVHAERRG